MHHNIARAYDCLQDQHDRVPELVRSAMLDSDGLRKLDHASKCSKAREFVSAFLTVLRYLLAYLTSFCLSKDCSSISS